MKKLTNGEWIRSMSDQELCDFIQKVTAIAVVGERAGMNARNLCNILWLQQKHKKVQKSDFI